MPAVTCHLTIKGKPLCVDHQYLYSTIHGEFCCEYLSLTRGGIALARLRKKIRNDIPVALVRGQCPVA